MAEPKKLTLKQAFALNKSNSDKIYAAKTELPTKTSELANDSNFAVDAGYVHTDNNYTTVEKDKLGKVAEGAQVNVIESVKVNGVAVTPEAKGVDISVPTTVAELSDAGDYAKAAAIPTNNNQLENGAGYLKAVPDEYVTDTELTAKGYQNSEQVKEIADASASSAVAGLGTALKYKGSVAAYGDLPTEGMKAGDTYNVEAANGDTPAGANYAWVEADGDVAAHWDAFSGTIDLSGYAQTADLDYVTDEDIDSLFATA